MQKHTAPIITMDIKQIFLHWMMILVEWYLLGVVYKLHIMWDSNHKIPIAFFPSTQKKEEKQFPEDSVQDLIQTLIY